ncbi:MAG: Si-specific NAD(P)(+) transhydrogenase [Acidobacteriota bacterium]
MLSQTHEFQVVVLGTGPAGQKAAIQAAKQGRQVAIVEMQTHAGGACVQYGTIPSKTLREAALALLAFKRRSAGCYQVEAREELKIQSLMKRLDQVVSAHQATSRDQLGRNGVTLFHGRGRFIDPRTIEIVQAGGRCLHLRSDLVVIATGSRPRTPDGIPVDHTQVLDSDSILSLNYLPESLTVLGSGVIACEYASIFATLGVKVTIADSASRPLAFIDPELSGRFADSFAASGGTFLGNRKYKSVEPDGVATVTVRFDDGSAVTSEKLFVALGRLANVQDLRLDVAGVRTTPRGHIEVDENLRTSAQHIYAAGDVIGPPALAASSMEQGRRAICHALGLPLGNSPEMIPIGIYTIPEISSVGLSEADARQRFGDVLIGRAPFCEVARGQIAGIEDGFLKLITDPVGRRLLGVHIVGEGAADLISVGQMALLAGFEVDAFVDNIFNFPTLTEGYRVAALDVVRQRVRLAAGVLTTA